MGRATPHTRELRSGAQVDSGSAHHRAVREDLRQQGTFAGVARWEPAAHRPWCVGDGRPLPAAGRGSPRDRQARRASGPRRLPWRTRPPAGVRRGPPARHTNRSSTPRQGPGPRSGHVPGRCERRGRNPVRWGSPPWPTGPAGPWRRPERAHRPTCARIGASPHPPRGGSGGENWPAGPARDSEPQLARRLSARRAQELSAPHPLLFITDGIGRVGQRGQRAKEPAVRLVVPGDGPLAPPAGAA